MRPVHKSTIDLRMITALLLVAYTLLTWFLAARSTATTISLALIPFFLFVPGYALSTFLMPSLGPLDRILASVSFSLGIVVCAVAVQEHLSGSITPLQSATPVASVTLVALGIVIVQANLSRRRKHAESDSFPD